MRRLLSLFALPLLVLAAACGGSPGESPSEPSALDAAAPSTTERLARGNDRYDGTVVAASVADQSFALDDGTTVRTSAATRWKSGGDRILSIVGLSDALAGGATIHARGKGTEDSPGVLLADDVDARAERNDAAQEQRFDDEVAGSDGTTVALEAGVVLRFDAATRWKSGPDRLTSLGALAAAVNGGLSVRARGEGLAQTDGSVLVRQIDARVREAATRNFRGPLTSVDAGTATLQVGDTTVQLLASTAWKRGPRRITSLVELEAAFLAAAAISVRGKGIVQPDGTIVAAEVDIQLASSALERFRGIAAGVDLTTREILLEDGTVIEVFDGTDWRRRGRWLGSLEAIDAALVAGEKVQVAGKGTTSPTGALLATRIKARVRPSGDDSGSDDGGSDDGGSSDDATY